MKILVVGGGSGGHITPAIAVVREILALKPRARVEFWTDRKYYKNVVKLTVLGKGDIPMKVRKVCSGKFRRYAGWSFADYFVAWRVTLVDLIFKNILGFFGFLAGVVQSFCRLVAKKERPDVIFLKGGFVGLPVGIVAKWLKIPYVIHESDATPGLANRILMKRASKVARGAKFDPEVPGREKWVWTGTPIREEFRKVSASREGSLKKAFGFCSDKPLVVVTGGSQGAKHINEAVAKELPEMLKFAADVMSAKNVREEKETSVIAAKPESIVHPIFVIAEMVVPNVLPYVKDVRNSVKTVPEKFVQAADIAVTVLLITAGVQTVTCVETV